MEVFVKLYQKNMIEIKFLFSNGTPSVQYHGGLRSRELGQAPMVQVFLTPRRVFIMILWESMNFHPD